MSIEGSLLQTEYFHKVKLFRVRNTMEIKYQSTQRALYEAIHNSNKQRLLPIPNITRKQQQKQG
jgi:hypothetical protein